MNSASLARLFETSFQQWGIDGRTAARSGDELGIDMQLGDNTAITLCRDETTGSRLPVWRLQIGQSRPVEATSLRMILGVLRTELDPAYRPGRLMMGLQASAAGGQRETA